MKRFVNLLNLGVVLAVIMAVPVAENLLSQNLNTNAATYQGLAVAQPNSDEYNHEASSSVKIDVQSGTGSSKNGAQVSSGSLNRCKSFVTRALKNLPAKVVGHLKNLTLSFDSNARRGLGGGSTIILRCSDVKDAELVAVLTHEMGHIMDTGVLQGSKNAGESEFMDGSNHIYKNDPSLDFYRLSFTDSKTIRQDVDSLNFVSGYAMSDPFEDFAESYAYYILHGNEFRKLAKSDTVLNKKYQFLKTRVFNGKEYVNGDESVSALNRNYDVTVLPYDMNKFFVI